MKKLWTVITILAIPLIFIGCSNNNSNVNKEENSDTKETIITENVEFANLVKSVIKDYEENKILINDNFHKMPDEFAVPTQLDNIEFSSNDTGGYQTRIMSTNGDAVMIIGIDDVLDEKTFEEVPMVVYVFFSVM